MAIDSSRITKLLKETVVLLCQNSLTYTSELSIQGLFGLTVDKSTVILVQVDEKVRTGASAGTSENSATRSNVGVSASRVSFGGDQRPPVARRLALPAPPVASPPTASEMGTEMPLQPGSRIVRTRGPRFPVGRGRGRPVLRGRGALSARGAFSARGALGGRSAGPVAKAIRAALTYAHSPVTRGRMPVPARCGGRVLAVRSPHRLALPALQGSSPGYQANQVITMRQRGPAPGGQPRARMPRAQLAIMPAPTAQPSISAVNRPPTRHNAPSTVAQHAGLVRSPLSGGSLRPSPRLAIMPAGQQSATVGQQLGVIRSPTQLRNARPQASARLALMPSAQHAATTRPQSMGVGSVRPGQPQVRTQTSPRMIAMPSPQQSASTRPQMEVTPRKAVVRPESSPRLALMPSPQQSANARPQAMEAASPRQPMMRPQSSLRLALMPSPTNRPQSVAASTVRQPTVRLQSSPRLAIMQSPQQSAVPQSVNAGSATQPRNVRPRSSPRLAIASPLHSNRVPEMQQLTPPSGSVCRALEAQPSPAAVKQEASQGLSPGLALLASQMTSTPVGSQLRNIVEELSRRHGQQTASPTVVPRPVTITPSTPSSSMNVQTTTNVRQIVPSNVTQPGMTNALLPPSKQAVQNAVNLTAHLLPSPRSVVSASTPQQNIMVQSPGSRGANFDNRFVPPASPLGASQSSVTVTHMTRTPQSSHTVVVPITQTADTRLDKLSTNPQYSPQTRFSQFQLKSLASSPQRLATPPQYTAPGMAGRSQAVVQRPAYVSTEQGSGVQNHTTAPGMLCGLNVVAASQVPAAVPLYAANQPVCGTSSPGQQFIPAPVHVIQPLGSPTMPQMPFTPTRQSEGVGSSPVRQFVGTPDSKTAQYPQARGQCAMNARQPVATMSQQVAAGSSHGDSQIFSPARQLAAASTHQVAMSQQIVSGDAGLLPHLRQAIGTSATQPTVQRQQHNAGGFHPALQPFGLSGKQLVLASPSTVGHSSVTQLPQQHQQTFFSAAQARNVSPAARRPSSQASPATAAIRSQIRPSASESLSSQVFLGYRSQNAQQMQSHMTMTSNQQSMPKLQAVARPVQSIAAAASVGQRAAPVQGQVPAGYSKQPHMLPVSPRSLLIEPTTTSHVVQQVSTAAVDQGNVSQQRCAEATGNKAPASEIVVQPCSTDHRASASTSATEDYPSGKEQTGDLKVEQTRSREHLSSSSDVSLPDRSSQIISSSTATGGHWSPWQQMTPVTSPPMTGRSKSDEVPPARSSSSTTSTSEIVSPFLTAAKSPVDFPLHALQTEIVSSSGSKKDSGEIRKEKLMQLKQEVKKKRELERSRQQIITEQLEQLNSVDVDVLDTLVADVDVDVEESCSEETVFAEQSDDGTSASTIDEPVGRDCMPGGGGDADWVIEASISMANRVAGRFQCKVADCGVLFRRTCQLATHYSECHPCDFGPPMDERGREIYQKSFLQHPAATMSPLVRTPGKRKRETRSTTRSRKRTCSRSSPGRHECDDCGRTFSRAGELSRHVRDCHFVSTDDDE